MAQVEWAIEALEEVAAIRAYIAQFDPDAANRIGERLLEAGNRLNLFPERGSDIGGGRRKLSIVWPYLIHYRVDGECVYILGVRHGARLPS